MKNIRVFYLIFSVLGGDFFLFEKPCFRNAALQTTMSSYKESQYNRDSNFRSSICLVYYQWETAIVDFIFSNIVLSAFDNNLYLTVQ